VSGGFVKIYGSILRSSVWQQPLTTKVVWITMLALADADGVVEASIPGLAATAGVTIEECEGALACFLAPDRYSGSTVDEGRRIQQRRGGWFIINHSHYRELRTEKQVREAERIASKRAQAKAAADCNASPSRQHVANVAGVAADPDPDPDLRSPFSPPCTEPADVAPSAGTHTPADAGDPAQGDSSTPPVAAVKPKRTRRPKRTRAAEVPLPADWAPTKTHAAYAAKHGLDLELEADGLRGWAEGRTQLSWNGAFSTRLANAAKWKRERGPQGRPLKPGAGADEERFL
jgi:hypothetical protein